MRRDAHLTAVEVAPHRRKVERLWLTAPPRYYPRVAGTAFACLAPAAGTRVMRYNRTATSSRTDHGPVDMGGMFTTIRCATTLTTPASRLAEASARDDGVADRLDVSFNAAAGRRGRFTGMRRSGRVRRSPPCSTWRLVHFIRHSRRWSGSTEVARPWRQMQEEQGFPGVEEERSVTESQRRSPTST